MGEHETHLLRMLPLLQQVLTRVGVHQTQAGADLGLTNAQMGVLGSVSQNDNCTMGELAADRLVVLPAATRMVDSLVRKKLVERVSDSKDRRVVRLRITQQGRETMDQVHQEAAVLLARVLAKMSEEEQEALLTGLTSFIAAVVAVEAEEDQA